jgi:putative transposase
VIESPRAYRVRQGKLRRAQRALSRCEPGSANRSKQRLRVARIHEKTRNVRNDFLHKTTSALVADYDALLIEDLSVKGLARTKLAKSIHDAAFGEFRRQLEYKALWQRKRVGTIGRFFPSSKLCWTCGAINNALTLANREWDCAACGAHHDRDLNAARNIEREGLRQLVAAGHAETENACGVDTRPPTEADDATARLAA